MAWFPFGKSPQVEQKSHSPLGLAPVDRPVAPGESDINHTLAQISNDKEIDFQIGKSSSAEEANKAVTQFVNVRPNNLFILDGEKDAERSIICTNNEDGGKTCLKLQYNSIMLFKQMQKLEYFCSLPDDINATYFECRKIK